MVGANSNRLELANLFLHGMMPAVHIKSGAKTRISLRRPQLGDIEGIDPSEVPDDVRRIFEQTAGRMWNQLVTALLDTEGFEELPAEEQALAIARAKRDAIAFARANVRASFPAKTLPEEPHALQAAASQDYTGCEAPVAG